MRRVCVGSAILLLLVLQGGVAFGGDIRQVYQDLRQQLKAQQQLQERKATSIGERRSELQQELSQLQQQVKTLEREVTAGEKSLQQAHMQLQRLEAQHGKDDAAMDALAASVRSAATHLRDLLHKSAFTALDPQRLEAVAKVVDKNNFPGIADLDLLVEHYRTDIRNSSKVQIAPVPYTDLGGRHETGTALLLGPFLAVTTGGEKGALLQYAPERREFRILDASLDWTTDKILQAYLAGKSDLAPIDLEAGAGLARLTGEKTFFQRVKEGGVLVWPIGFIALCALLIGVERTLFLKRVHDNTDRTMGEVNRHAEQGDWEKCRNLVAGRRTPVYNVVRAGLNARHEQREILESILQEAILKELPRLERALPILNIMGAIAPLLGLLGTVTGMISTFEVINIYGTGDPHLMSGGISVALVTTMLGLMVAIPIMLLHTFLSRQVEHIIGDMEEKSVTLTNIVSRYKA